MQATVTPTPISWDNLEKFHKMLSQITQKGDYLSATNQGVTPNTIRRMAYRLRNIQEGSLQGFPDVQQQFGDVRKAWKAEVGPVQRMAGVAGKVTAANPLESSTGKQVLQRFGGFDLEDTTRISKALQEIGPNTPQANLVRASMWSKFLGGKSPEQIGKAWEELGQTNPEAIKLLRGANGAQVDRNLQKIAKIAKYVGSDTRGMIRRNALAVITAGTTGLVFGMQRGTASLWDGTLPLGMLMAYGTGRGIQTFVRALHTPRGTQEAARLGVLVAREAERIYDRANEGVQAYEEE